MDLCSRGDDVLGVEQGLPVSNRELADRVHVWEQSNCLEMVDCQLREFEVLLIANDVFGEERTYGDITER
jgi:uncharacterized membrane protein